MHTVAVLVILLPVKIWKEYSVQRTLEGMPFRDAYKGVGIEVNEGRFRYMGAEGKTNGQLTPDDLRHTSIGSLGNLCNDRIKSKMEKAAEF